MHSILDSGHLWFLGGVRFSPDFRLEVTVREGFRSRELTRDELAPGVPLGGYEVAPDASSRTVKIGFASAAAFSVVDESYAYKEEGGTDGPGKLEVYRRSKFLSYLETVGMHGIFFRAPPDHYRIYCCDFVVNVVSDVPPEFEVT